MGVGDSLTAGVQSNGISGMPGTSPLSSLPGNAVPPTQENSWWAIFYAKAHPGARLNDPARSPLPLINAPGLGAQLVPSTSNPPFAASHSGCDAINTAAFTLSGAMSTVRANSSDLIYDVAVPGQTTHEALYMRHPSTTALTCGTTGSANSLAWLRSAESQAFYPILGGFAGKMRRLTQVNAAVSLHPALATVWLGANDLSKFVASGGSMSMSDAPSKMQSDLTEIVRRLQRGGAHVLMANLPDVLRMPFFFRGGMPSSAVPSQSVAYFLQKLGGSTVTPSQIAYVLYTLKAQYGVGRNGYVTAPGMFQIYQTATSPSFNPLASNAFGLDPSGAGSGAGKYYVPDALAAKVRTLNAQYNVAIAASAKARHAALVDMQAYFAAMDANGLTLPGARPVSSLFGGGAYSFDGIHPSDVLYAGIAGEFIAAANASYGTNIPGMTRAENAAIYAADPYRMSAF